MTWRAAFGPRALCLTPVTWIKGTSWMREASETHFRNEDTHNSHNELYVHALKRVNIIHTSCICNHILVLYLFYWIFI